MAFLPRVPRRRPWLPSSLFGIPWPSSEQRCGSWHPKEIIPRIARHTENDLSNLHVRNSFEDFGQTLRVIQWPGPTAASSVQGNLCPKPVAKFTSKVNCEITSSVVNNYWMSNDVERELKLTGMKSSTACSYTISFLSPQTFANRSRLLQTASSKIALLCG